MSTTRITGKVKWFNSRAGYGFITACEGEFVDKDIFVHFSSIKSDAAHYKHLTQGEYVDFSLTKPENEKHEYHAIEVTGVKGGPILCETRRLNAISGKHYSEGGDREEEGEQRVPVSRKPSVRSSQESSDPDGFHQVKRSSSAKKRAPSTKTSSSK